MTRIILKGHTASRGSALGRAVLLPLIRSNAPQKKIPEENVEFELERFRSAIDSSGLQLRDLIESSDLPEDSKAIFEAQILLLEDPMLVEETFIHIENKFQNAAWALTEVLEKLIIRLDALESELFRERVSDLEDIGNRIIANLDDSSEYDACVNILKNLPGDSILVARNISPSLMLHVRSISGIATEQGGITGHIAILARNRGIPALVGVENIFSHVSEGDRLLINTEQKSLVINPGESDIAFCHNIRRHIDISEIDEIIPEYSLDNDVKISIYANLDEPEDAEDPRLKNVYGIGLFRSEFMYLRDPALFDAIDEQIRLYSSVLDRMGKKPVIFRLIDVGDDKTFEKFAVNRKHSLKGRRRKLRGIRFLLANEDLMISQIRAILSAIGKRKAADSDCSLMLPMVSRLEEVLRFKEYLGKIYNEFQKDYPGIIPELPVGLMLETPSACLMADALSDHSDFFSIGTNDLARFMLAADRSDSAFMENQYYQPSIYRMIETAVQKSTKQLCICGALASEPEFLPILIGLGVKEFSIAPAALADFSRAVKLLKSDKCRTLAGAVLGARDSNEVRSILAEN